MALSKTILGLYLLVLLWLVLFKFSFDLPSVLSHQIEGLNLVPFADASSDNLREMIFNFVVFIPLGLLLSVNLKRASFWQKLSFIFALSLSVELIQMVFAIGITDVTDLTTNTLGGLLGLLFYEVSKRDIETEKLDRFIVLIGVMLLILFILLRFFFLNIRFHSTPGLS